MWLWDFERSRGSLAPGHLTVAVVSGSDDIAPYVEDLTRRGYDVFLFKLINVFTFSFRRIRVVVVPRNSMVASGLLETSAHIVDVREILDEFSVDDFANGTAIDAIGIPKQSSPPLTSTASSSLSGSPTESSLGLDTHFPVSPAPQNSLFMLPVPQVPHAYLPAYVNYRAPAMMSASYMPRVAGLSYEEFSLYDEFKRSFEVRNVKVAVSALRKIYPKQSRGLRIPDLLAELLPPMSTIASGSIAHMYVTFVLHCIQWCFGLRAKRKGETVDSFKYNMNKNIACWLLNSLHQKGLTAPAIPEVVKSAEDVVRHVLDSVAELDFCLEILEAVGVRVEASRRLVGPALSYWQTCKNAVYRGRANAFAVKHGFPTGPSAATTPFDVCLSSLDDHYQGVSHSIGGHGDREVKYPAASFPPYVWMEPRVFNVPRYGDQIC